MHRDALERDGLELLRTAWKTPATTVFFVGWYRARRLLPQMERLLAPACLWMSRRRGLIHAATRSSNLRWCRSPMDQWGDLCDRRSLQCAREPQIPLPAAITAITGITEDMLRGQTIDPVAVMEIAATADLVVAHNATFDRPFLEGLCDAFEFLHGPVHGAMSIGRQRDMRARSSPIWQPMLVSSTTGIAPRVIALQVLNSSRVTSPSQGARASSTCWIARERPIAGSGPSLPRST